MKKKLIFWVILICIVCFMPFLFNKSNQPKQNTFEIVAEKLKEKYDINFTYVTSLIDENGDISYQCYPNNNNNLIIEASYYYTRDPLYVFPFVKRVIFKDNMVECIRNFCILDTFGSNDIYISKKSYDYETLSEKILECINLIELMFYDYKIDEKLNSIYILLNFIYGNKTFTLEFTKESQEKIISQILDALQK